MTELNIEGLTKTFHDERRGTVDVFEDVSFTVESESFTTIMGPSGCGKTTILNVLAGLHPPDAGHIRLNGRAITPGPGQLPFAYVFQEPRLLNWRTVEENIAFALRLRGIPGSEHAARIEKTLEMVGLADEKNTFPLRLSGGMRQRVGVARAFAVDPEILLMDEPFSELDELTARNLRSDVIDLWQETGKTIVFVTHDITEAVYLSDKIIFLNDRGRIFSENEIPVERPRQIDSQELIEVERELMSQFLDNVSSIE